MIGRRWFLSLLRTALRGSAALRPVLTSALPAILLLSAFPAQARPSEVRVGIAVPPEVAAPQSSPVLAAFLDLIGPLLTREMGLKTQTEFVSRHRLLQDLRAGRLEIGFPLERAEGNQAWLLNSSPLISEQLVLLVPPDRTFPVSLKSLSVRVLGGRLGTAYPELEARAGVRIERFDSSRTAVRLLLAGRIDGVIVESQTMLPTVRQWPEAQGLTRLPVAVGDTDLTVGFARHRFSERDVWRFNLGLTRLMDRPLYDMLLRHHQLQQSDQALPLMALEP